MQKIYSFILLLLSTSFAFSQSDGKKASFTVLGNQPIENTDSNSSGFTGQSGTGANIDVIYHKIFWRINPDSGSVSTPTKYIRGSVQTNFKTIVNNVSTISFDLLGTLTIDSVKFRGAKLPGASIVRSGNITTLTLGATLTNNFIDSFTVFYRGAPPAVSGAAEGYQTAKTPTANQNYIYTLSESYEDRDWWPCKADMQDKVDSMDITVSVPWSGADTFWVATNGKLVDSTIAGGNRQFTFKNRYPMASYLVGIAVARYDRYYRSITLPSGYVLGGVFNIFRGKASYTTITSAMAIQDSVVYKFSQKFGDYPFKRDKYGYYEGLGGAGGMEHQSFYAMASTSLTSQSTLSHELMHQWFGDKATFATWADLWLAEGFARYGEALAGELHPATGINPVAELAAAKTAARGNTSTPTRIASFTTSNQVWTGTNVSAVYDRGCMVVSMLRALSGDNNFFLACRNYLDSANGSGYKSATTDSLKNNFNRVLNYDLTPFFDDWVIRTGHPTTVINWNAPTPGVLAVSVATQTKSASNVVGRFHNVIVLRVQGALAAQDTTIVFYDIDGNNLAKAGNGIAAATPGNLLYYNLSFTPTTVTFDPFNRTMSAGSTSFLSTLDLKILDFTVKQNGNAHDAVLILDDNSINTGLILERSTDGTGFTELGTMQLQPNNPQNNKQYYFRDAAPLAGVNYYRVKFKDAAGRYKYSKIIKLTTKIIADKFSIVNNPTDGNVKLKVLQNSLLNEDVVFTLYDPAGRRMLQTAQKIVSLLIELETSKLAKGAYIIKIYTGNQMLQSIKCILR